MGVAAPFAGALLQRPQCQQRHADPGMAALSGVMQLFGHVLRELIWTDQCIKLYKADVDYVQPARCSCFSYIHAFCRAYTQRTGRAPLLSRL